MGRSTTRVLSAAIQAAVLAACKEKTSGEVNIPPPPPPSSPTSSTTSIPIASGPSAAPTSVVSPTQLQFGQRCLGKTLAALKPNKPVDSLELRLEYFQPEHVIMIAGQSGAPCARATMPQRCRDALVTARPAKSAGEYVVYTRVDEVGAVAGEDIAPFLAPIDSAEEAAMALVYPLAAKPSGAVPPCDASAFHPAASGWETIDVQQGMCNEATKNTWLVATDGAAQMTKTEHVPPTPGCNPHPFLGRRPEGLEEGSAAGTEVGSFFARCAELEAASVRAFERLGRELRAMRAPRALRDRARRSREDEVRHARAMRALARRHGGSSTPPSIAEETERDLESIAIENAIEGCVSEAYGALVATWQAAHAEDEVVRRAMRVIARDETRHAALAMDLAEHLDARLSEDARARVRHARERATRELADTFVDPSPELARVAGLPTRAQALTMARSLFQFT